MKRTLRALLTVLLLVGVSTSAWALSVKMRLSTGDTTPNALQVRGVEGTLIPDSTGAVTVTDAKTLKDLMDAGWEPVAGSASVDALTVINTLTVTNTLANKCSGQVATVGGTIVVKAPCAAAYTYCGASIGQAPVVAGNVPGCVVTSTATTAPTSTATVGGTPIATTTATTAAGFGISVATAALGATESVNYWGGPQ